MRLRYVLVQITQDGPRAVPGLGAELVPQAARVANATARTFGAAARLVPSGDAAPFDMDEFKALVCGGCAFWMDSCRCPPLPEADRDHRAIVEGLRFVRRSGWRRC